MDQKLFQESIHDDAQRLLQDRESLECEDSVGMNDHNVGQESGSRPRKRSCTRSVLLLLSRLLIASLAVWGVVDISRRIWAYRPHPNRPPSVCIVPNSLATCYCAPTAPAALDVGCSYDEMLGAWLPAQCQDIELARMFDDMRRTDAHNWVYYDYSNSSRELTTLQLSMLASIDADTGSTAFVNKDWQVSRCLYIWLRQARMSLTGTIMTPLDHDLELVKHCTELIWANVNESSRMNESTSTLKSILFPE